MPPSRAPVPFKPYSVFNIDRLGMMAAIHDNAADMVFAGLPFNRGKKYRPNQKRILDWLQMHLKEAANG